MDNARVHWENVIISAVWFDFLVYQFNWDYLILKIECICHHNKSKRGSAKNTYVLFKFCKSVKHVWKRDDGEK